MSKDKEIEFFPLIDRSTDETGYLVFNLESGDARKEMITALNGRVAYKVLRELYDSLWYKAENDVMSKDLDFFVNSFLEQLTDSLHRNGLDIWSET